ncbi:MAG: two-component system, OmpR family, sensor kinase [Acidobacteriota bacterium]|jgi:heavy metal sensor kinase|nr:two-component system, OmpR family, sensor kinase [Acidobacteriota bacterium]
MLDSVRVRLTLWYMSVLALVLIGFSVALYVMVARSLYGDLDDNLRLSLETVTVKLVRELGENKPERQAALDAINELSTREAAAVYTSSGVLIAEQPAHGDIHARLHDGDSIPPDEIYLETESQFIGGVDVSRRVAAQLVNAAAKNAPYVLVVSEPFDSVTDGLGAIRDMLYITVPGALLLSGLGGWFLARRSLASVVAMSERARRISAESLEQRLPVVNPRDELGRLASTFNELLARLDESFSHQRRFMADASHELRTPLSVLRTATDVTLEREGRAEGEYRDALKIIDEQARRLTHIVEDMFMLARADVGQHGLRPCDFYLDELMTEAGRAADVLASRKMVAITVAPVAETPFHGDEGLLRQMLLNLLDNAVKHTSPGGSIHISLARTNGHYSITVSDTGTGIPIEAQPHIFERFYRVDKARSRAEAVYGASSGAGLGLSIARWIAEAHGGQLVLQHTGEAGSTFVASFPLTEIPGAS